MVYVGRDGGGEGGGGCWLSEDQGRALGGEEHFHRTADREIVCAVAKVSYRAR